MSTILHGPRDLFLNITLINNEDEDYFVDMEAFHLTALHCGSPTISVFGPSQEYDFSVKSCRSVSPDHYSRNIASDYYQSSFRKILSREGVEVHYNIPGSFLDHGDYHDFNLQPGAYTVLFDSSTSCCTQEQAQSLYSTSFEEVMYYCIVDENVGEYVDLVGETKFEVFPNHFDTEQGEL